MKRESPPLGMLGYVEYCADDSGSDAVASLRPRNTAAGLALEAIFRRLDRNGDGKLTPDELPAGQRDRLMRLSPFSTSAVGGVITMGRIRLGVGTEWPLDGRAWRVVRQLAPDRFVAQDDSQSVSDRPGMREKSRVL